MDTAQQERLNALTLSRMGFYNIPAMRELLHRAGSFTNIANHHDNILDIVPDCPKRLANSLKDIAPLQQRAEEELEYAAAHGIQVLLISDDDYPQRLKECNDAPLVLFYKGNADLNAKRVINIVGTRHATQYADDCIRKFIADIKVMCPEILIASGLAYGVDIMAHRHSLENGIPTVGVLAHGLDNLYPPRHRETADRMVECGGLLTEHFTNTNADKVNFVRRNRIVAGMSDATILVESAAKGGGLITCSLANSYNRDVFAFPGRIGDSLSEGCNKIIRNRSAQMVISAESFVSDMGWETDAQLATAQKNGIERSLFPEVEGDAKTIIDALAKNNDQQMNVLTASTGLPINRLTALLFELEMKGMVKALAGGMYHLIS